jgi:predicted patatin/cPLA2 family phospholipase
MSGTGVDTAIVVEGGAMRGIFSAGALDALLRLGLSDFDLAIGTSAGACNLASFVAGQHERNLRCYTNIMTRPQLFSLRRAVRGGHYMDLDWLWERFAAEDPLDEAAVAASRTQLVSVATCAQTARALYIEAAGPHIHNDLKAGCTLPILYRGPYQIGAELVVDGGLVDPIPVREAYRRGARRIVVIRSRPAHVVKKDSRADALTAALFWRTPSIARAVRETARRYQEAVAFLQRPPEDVELIELAPETTLATTRTTQRVSTLREDYSRGQIAAERAAARIRALLSAAPRAAQSYR